ncbi:PcfK-like family protein [Bacteroides sp.]|uniref:PcfK-like family protein n=1 Tax=Bacteroides sp. TaxID=29523 RepID=UPI0025B9F89E|nr:PcfK-like family protein [Bacteroides sp.]
MKAENTVSNYFKITIQSYLEQRAQTDELFAPVYAKPNKNIDDCITYIINYVKQSGINGFADDEIYSLALHYYDEDNIEVGKPINCNVVVNHAIVLTDEEKAQARQKAIQKVQDEAYTKMKQPKSKPKAKQTEQPKELSLF